MKHRTRFAAIWLALLPMGANCQVYKCIVDGRTAYTERPCGQGEAPVRLRGDVPVTAAEREEARRSLDRQRTVLEEIEARNAADLKKADATSRAMRSEQQLQKERCKALIKEAQAADNDSRMYRYHQGLIDDALRRRKEAEDKHFSECFVNGW